MTDNDRKFMLLAIEQAQLAGSIGEVPVGAVIVDKDNAFLAPGHNLREKNQDPTAHAEIIAIREASQKIEENKEETSLKSYPLHEKLVLIAIMKANGSSTKISTGQSISCSLTSW